MDKQKSLLLLLLISVLCVCLFVGNYISNSSNSKTYIISTEKESGDITASSLSPPDSGNTKTVVANPVYPVNINTATVEQLCTIPGVDEDIANDIVSFRVNNGPYLKIQDLMHVSENTSNIFSSISDFISVTDRTPNHKH